MPSFPRTGVLGCFAHDKPCTTPNSENLFQRKLPAYTFVSAPFLPRIPSYVILVCIPKFLMYSLGVCQEHPNQ